VERPTKIVVIDASVVVKWFVEEELTNQALTLAEDYERRRVDLRSVQLMPFEVMNALRYNPELGETEVEKAGEALTRLGVALHPPYRTFTLSRSGARIGTDRPSMTRRISRWLNF
jgi:predicted nucleic acid-binding protein